MNIQEIQKDALHKATTGQSLSNYPVILEEFSKRGIPESEIKPRENVFTFNAWRALGRTVKKGEHGVKVCTWINSTITQTNDRDGKDENTRRIPRTTTVFHISQTKPIN